MYHLMIPDLLLMLEVLNVMLEWWVRAVNPWKALLNLHHHRVAHFQILMQGSNALPLEELCGLLIPFPKLIKMLPLFLLAIQVADLLLVINTIIECINQWAIRKIDKKESSTPQQLDNYADVGLVQDSTNSFDSQRQQDASDLPTFSAYDPQTGYDLSYFRPNTADEAVRRQGLLSPQEVLSTHGGNIIPASSIGMVPQVQQQQQQPVAQMYPQVHVPHFTSIMPYRQFLSPVYVPPMAMPGYSSNPAYQTSEIWMNARDVPNMQTGSYFNMPAQTPHGAYMPSHSGHASFNAAAVAQSSHMQFPVYHPPPQPTPIANPHHLGTAINGNVGVGMAAAAAPGTQLGAYQQPQLGHLNWTGNF
nr:GBF-interacting protein 1-like isoform X4 [Ipomoea batatas]